MQEVATPDQKTISEVSAFLKVPVESTVKTLVLSCDGEPVAVVLRGDHELNLVKLTKVLDLNDEPEFMDDESVRAATGCAPGSLGPVGLGIRTVVDRSAAVLADFVCGANKEGVHLTGVNWERDVPLNEVADIRNVVEGDPSPDGKGVLVLRKGIEVGHVFKLGDKYSRAMNAAVLDENGKSVIMQMGCYGIGVSRVVAATIEQNHDDRGIIWPEAIAPFQLVIVTLNAHKSDAVREAGEELYARLRAAGYDVLLDDRNERPGVKFADMELIGIPHRVVISDRGLKAGTLEYKGRTDESSQDIPLAEAEAQLRERLLAP